MTLFAIGHFATKRKSAAWWHLNTGNNMLSCELNVLDEMYGNIPTIPSLKTSTVWTSMIPEYEKKCKSYAISLLVEGVRVFPYPKLDEISANKVIDAKSAWLILTDFLSSQKQSFEKTVPIGDDKLRIQSHGFDLKTSFRKGKK